MTERVYRSRIMEGKPDASIFPYSRQIARKGFPALVSKGCIPSLFSLPVHLIHSLFGINSRNNSRDASAINAVLIEGLDDRVAAKVGQRPPFGLAINHRKNDDSPDYRPATLLPPRVNRDDPHAFNESYSQTFREFRSAVADTYNEALQIVLENVVQRAQSDIVTYSILRRINQIRGYDGLKAVQKTLQSNIDQAALEITNFLEVIPFVARRYAHLAPQDIPAWEWYQSIAKNSRSFVLEFALTDTDIMSFTSVLWLEIVEGDMSSEERASVFQLVGEDANASLDFSEEFKAEIHKLENSRRRWFGCPAARVITPGRKSQVVAIWDRLVPIAGSIYQFYFA